MTFNASPSLLGRPGIFIAVDGDQRMAFAMREGKAVSLLMESRLSLQAIAEQLGYSDTANFSHAFKKWTGQPPGSFRRGDGA